MRKEKDLEGEELLDSLFKEFYDKLPEKDKELFDSMGIKSMWDMMSVYQQSGLNFAGKLLGELNKIVPAHKISGKKNKRADMRILKHQEYHLRIKLVNAPVPVWREFKVSSDTDLVSFAMILNAVMGWEGYHLYEFRKGNDCYSERTDDDEDDFSMFDRMNHLDANEYVISDLLTQKGSKMKYEYDFGDGWLHEIWVKGIRDYDPDDDVWPTVINGKGACPPEDCGGVYGYAELLELRNKKRKSADDKGRLQWYGIDSEFDPDYFDIIEVNGMLADFQLNE